MPRGAWEGSLMFWAVKGPARGQQTPEQMPSLQSPGLTPQCWRPIWSSCPWLCQVRRALT